MAIAKLKPFLKYFLIIFSLILFNLTQLSPVLAEDAIAKRDTGAILPSYYRSKKIHNPDGIGKYYLDREIAHYMGHQAMMWLERDSRELEEQPEAVIDHLELKPTDTVADLGTGTGYFALRIAEQIPQGKVYAVDIQPEMLDALQFLQQEKNIANVETILGTEDNPKLPQDSIDLALMVDAYHEFAYPREMMENLYQSLRPGGKVVLVEYRQENPMIMIKPLHKMSQKQVKKEMKAVNLKWLKTQQFLPEQHFMVFQKPEV